MINKESTKTTTTNQNFTFAYFQIVITIFSPLKKKPLLPINKVLTSDLALISLYSIIIYSYTMPFYQQLKHPLVLQLAIGTFRIH